MNYRIKELDIMRGLGIILVILGHCSSSFFPILTNLINSFHMPLFFFVSGCTYHYNSLDILIIKKYYSLCVPLFIYAIYNQLLLLGTEILVYDNFYKDIILHCFSIRGQWFLESLLIITFLSYYIQKLSKNKNYNDCVIVILYTLGIMFSCTKYIHERVITSMVALLFFWAGIRSKNILFLKLSKIPTNIIFVSCMVLITILISLPKCSVLMYKNLYGNPWIFTLRAVIGILTIILLSKALSLNKLYKYLGSNSLCIFIIYFPIYMVFERILSKVIKSNVNYIPIIVFIITVILSIIISRIIDKIFPEFCGNRRE